MWQISLLSEVKKAKYRAISIGLILAGELNYLAAAQSRCILLKECGQEYRRLPLAP
jgi:hypothetical protein